MWQFLLSPRPALCTCVSAPYGKAQTPYRSDLWLCQVIWASYMSFRSRFSFIQSAGANNKGPSGQEAPPWLREDWAGAPSAVGLTSMHTIIIHYSWEGQVKFICIYFTFILSERIRWEQLLIDNNERTGSWLAGLNPSADCWFLTFSDLNKAKRPSCVSVWLELTKIR